MVKNDILDGEMDVRKNPLSGLDEDEDLYDIWVG